MPSEVDVKPMHTVPVYLSLGSNQQPQANLQRAIAALQHIFGKLVLSCVHQSAAQNIQGADFLNMVVKLDCHLNRHDLCQCISHIETQQGRKRDLSEKNGHPIDIDLLFYDNQVDATQNIPHRDIYTKAYVLKPLMEIAPALICPKTKQSMQQIWHNHNAWAPTQIVDFEWPTS